MHSENFRPYYLPGVDREFFAKKILYSNVIKNRNNLNTIVDYYERRVRDWYIDPIEVLLESNIKSDSKFKPLQLLVQLRLKLSRRIGNRDKGGHYSFVVMALTCMLIDTLAQFQKGLLKSIDKECIRFIKENLPSYSNPLTEAIYGYRPRDPEILSEDPIEERLKTIANVLFSGCRCGILHEQHAPLYCQIYPGNKKPEFKATGRANYGPGAIANTNGDECPVIIIYPEHLFFEVLSYFESYISNLKNSAAEFNDDRINFKKKFSHSFGVDITDASLKK